MVFKLIYVTVNGTTNRNDFQNHFKIAGAVSKQRMRQVRHNAKFYSEPVMSKFSQSIAFSYSRSTNSSCFRTFNIGDFIPEHGVLLRAVSKKLLAVRNLENLESDQITSVIRSLRSNHITLERYLMKTLESNSNMGLSPIDVISEIILCADDLSQFIKSFDVKPFGNLAGMTIQAKGSTTVRTSYTLLGSLPSIDPW